MVKNPKISVIIPVYNVAAYLRKCLDSVLGQSYLNLEVLLVDDGSADSSGDICDEYAKKDERIRVFHQKNRGLSAARNLALDNMSGDYVACVDADDYIEADMYEAMMAQMDDETDIVCCGTNSIFPADVRKNYVSYKTHVCTKYRNNEMVRELFLFHISFSSCDKLFRRRLFEGLRYPEGKVCEDLPVLYELVSRSRKMVNIGEAKYNYVYRADSISRQNFYPARMYYAIFSRDIVMDVQARYPDLVKEAKAWYINNIVSVLESIIISPNAGKYEVLAKRLRRIIRKRSLDILRNPYISGERKRYYFHNAVSGETCIGRIFNKLLEIF